MTPTRKVARSFRGYDYEYGVTGKVIHERCLSTGFETVYKWLGGDAFKRSVVARQTRQDLVGDGELIALLNGVLAEARRLQVVE